MFSSKHSAVQGVTINRLLIRGRQQHCQQLQSQLSLMDWPESNEHEWVFIKKLHVQKPSHKILTTLQQEAHQSITQAAPSDNTKRFAHINDLLSALISDLIKGTAEEKWYWQRWSHLFSINKSSAIRQLLSEHCHHINAVLEQLSDQQKLADFWQQINDDDAKMLLAELTYQGGHAQLDSSCFELQAYNDAEVNDLLAHLTRVNSAHIHSLKQVPDNSYRQFCILYTIASQYLPLALLQSPKKSIQTVRHWWNSQSDHEQQTSTDKTSATDKDNDQRLANSQISKQSTNTYMNTDGNSLDDNDNDTYNNNAQYNPLSHDPISNDPLSNGPLSHHQLNNSNLNSGQSNNSPTTNDTTESHVKKKSDHENINTDKLTTQELIENDASTFNDSQKLAQQTKPQDLLSISKSANATKGIDGFATQQGGLLFLLNILNRQEMQRIMQDHWSIYPTGWHWLFRLGEQLGLDDKDPLQHCLLEAMGIDNNSPLSQLAPLPDATRIRQLLAQWYDPETLWNQDLLSLPARVHVSSSHVDLFASLNHVRLDVRLAGLDINPGWLPWLGRIVHFHFQEFD